MTTYLLYHREAGDYINQEALSENQFVATGTQTISNTSYTRFDFTNEVMDKGGNFDIATDEFTAPVQGVYSFQLVRQSFTSITTGKFTNVAYRLSGSPFNAPNFLGVINNALGPQTFNFSVTLNAGQSIEILCAKDGITDQEIELSWTLTRFPNDITGGNVELNLFAPKDYRVLDFVADVAKQFNLVINGTDTNTFELSPLSLWYGQGGAKAIH